MNEQNVLTVKDRRGFRALPKRIEKGKYYNE
jgi:hypothetical protein